MNKELKNKLDSIFSILWGFREPIKGIWKADAYRDHRIYIHRGYCLLEGNTSLERLYILVPNGNGEMKLTPIIGDSAANMNITPTLENGEFVKIEREENGPWENFLDKEANLILQEINNIQLQRLIDIEMEHQRYLETRNNELNKAKALFK